MVSEDQYQKQLDTRAIELAAEMKGQMGQINVTLTAHLKDCLEERRHASEQRHNFREEVGINMRAIESKVDHGVASLDKKISTNNKMTISLVLGVASTIILLLIGLVGFLLPYAIKSIQLLPPNISNP